MAGAKHHDYHLVNPSVWPLIGSVAALTMFFGLVMTMHADHFGGVEGLLKLVRIDHFWDRGLPEDGTSEDFPDGPKRDDPLGIAYRKASQGKRTALGAGEHIPLKGDVSLLVLTSGGRVATQDELRIMQPVPNPLCADAPPDKLYVRLAAGKLTPAGDRAWRLNDVLTMTVRAGGTPIVRGEGDQKELIVPLHTDDRRLEVDYAW